MKTLLVLIVEDDHNSQVGLRGLLARDHRIETCSASSIGEALSYFDREPRPDVVLLDLKLPNEAGEDFIPAIREMGHDPRIVVPTGLHDDERIVNVEKMNPHRILMKPYRLEDLIAAIVDDRD